MNSKYQSIVDKILKDKKYLDWMSKIEEMDMTFANSNEENGKIAFDHSLNHALRVAKLVSKLLSQLGSDENMISLGYIAALLHDVGCSESKKGHAQKGSNLIKEYLKDFELDNSEKEIIVNAIARHGKSEGAKDLIDYCLVLADKCDYNKIRVLPGKYADKAYLNMIISNDVNFKDNKLILEFETIDNYDNSVFYTIPKSIDEPMLIGEILGYNVEFWVNNKLERFGDRDNYTGFVY